MVKRLFLFLLLMSAAGRVASAASSEDGIDINLLNQGKPAFPRVWQVYRPAPLPPVDPSNGPQFTNYLHQGKLALTLGQFLQLVIENNLSVEAARYNYLISQVDLLRTHAGQAARGVPGVPVPAGLFAGAIGAGVGNIVNVTNQGTGGTAISGNAKSVNVSPRGIFDPTLSINMSWDRVVNPLNTTKVAGVSTVAIPSTVLQTRWQQQLPFGTGYSFSFNMQRQSTTQRNILYNPSWTSFFSFTVYHPLMNGAGRSFTKRFVDLAENDRRIAYEAFHIDLNNALSAAANAYWDFVALKERERVAEQALALAERVYETTKQRIDLGNLASSELITAEAQVAANRRDLIIAQTNTQLQEEELKNFITKLTTSDVASLPIEPLDALAGNIESPIPPLDEAMKAALRRAPIRLAELGLENQKIAETFTRSNLRPTLSAFAEINSFSLSPALSNTLKQMWQYSYPEYTVGFTLSFSVKNRAAQADDLRARLDQQQAQVALEQTKANIGIQVRTALTSSAQTRAQVAAAQRAVAASQKTAEAEQMKWDTGFSTLENVYQTEIDLTRAQAAEIQSRLDYAKSMIAQEVAVGNFNERHDIDYDKALQGRLWKGSTNQ